MQPYGAGKGHNRYSDDDTALEPDARPARERQKKPALDDEAGSPRRSVYQCRRSGCEYRMLESEIAGSWCPRCGGRVAEVGG